MDKSLSAMSILSILLFSFLLHSVANCQLTFDRVNKNGVGQGWHLKRMTRPSWSDQINSFQKHSSGQPVVEDPLYQKSLEVSHRLLSELGIRDSVEEFMIQQVLLACYEAEEEDSQVKIGHKYDHQGFQVSLLLYFFLLSIFQTHRLTI